jgi:hypothetical protein
MVSAEHLSSMFNRLSPEDQQMIAGRYLDLGQFGTRFGQLPESDLGLFVSTSVLGDAADALGEEIRSLLSSESD